MNTPFIRIILRILIVRPLKGVGSLIRGLQSRSKLGVWAESDEGSELIRFEGCARLGRAISESSLSPLNPINLNRVHGLRM